MLNEILAADPRWPKSASAMGPLVDATGTIVAAASTLVLLFTAVLGWAEQNSED